MHWKWLIIVYLFLGGLGAGAYLTSFAAERGWLGKNTSLDRIGYIISAPIVAVGTVLLVFDLGQGLRKPWLLIGLLKNPTSVMTWGVYILALFIVIGLIKAYFIIKNKTAPSFIDIIGAILALATGAYTGLLLTVIEAVPFWATYLMPVLFIVSALSTGLSITVLLSVFINKDKYKEGLEGKAHIWLIAVELVVVIAFLAIMLTGVNGPVGVESAELLTTGAYSFIFWAYFLGLGLIFPLIVFIRQERKSRQTSSTTVEQAQVSFLTLITDLMVVVGGFALRALIILAAIPVWDGFTI